MEQCPCCNSRAIKETGERKEKDELDYKIVVIKRRHKFVEYKCEECRKKFHQEIPNNLKEEIQYGPQVQALELTLMNQGNVTINKAQKITYGMTNGEIDLSEGYISQLHKNKEGLEDDGILLALPKETVVVHDHNKVNYGKEYQFQNAECNRHLISDLKKVIDNLNYKWAKQLIELLTKMNKKREWLIKKGLENFEQEALNKFEDKFEKIMIEANRENLEEGKKYYVDEEKN